MMNFVYSSLETSDLICLLIDATLKFGHGDEFVIDTLKKISTPIFLLINKVDIVKKEKILLMIDKYKDLMEFKEIIPISALKGTNVDVLEENIYKYLPEAEKLYGDDDISDQSLRFLMSEIVREKLLSHVRQELPFVTAVYIEQMENRGAGKKYIKARIFVEKDTHRKIIIGRQGSLIKTIGTEARKEMEDILEAKVYLDLHVRVKEKWRDLPGVLDLIEGQ
jgi:GTP-binding protein Era